jgi:murein DD-endopeptidase MepM/ murein hydrolase activator NlpD
MMLRWGLVLALLFSGSALAEVPLELDGALVQGGIVVGRTDAAASVRFGETELMVSDEGYFVFGLSRDFQSPARLSLTLGDETLDRTLEVAPREYNIQYVDGVPQETVTPPPEVLDRIRREGVIKHEARAPVSARTDFASEFIWPLTGPISGTYGSQRVYNGSPGNPHLGVDVAQPAGTPIVAPAAGTVALAEPDMYFEGGLIFLDHGHGMIDVFMHLSEVLVEVGQTVEQGEVIGLVGAGGRATGPHLDWRMYVMGARVDPSNLVGPMPEEEPEGESGVGDQ